MNNKNDLDFSRDVEGLLEKSETEAPVRKRRAKKRRGFPLFYIIYFSAIALFIVALAFGLKYINTLLYEYEAVQPKYKAEEIFNEYFADPDIGQLIDMAQSDYAAFEAREAVLDYLTAQIEGKEITYAESSVTESQDVRSYNVFCGGVRFSVFTMDIGDEKTAHGFSYYRLKDVRLTFSLPDNSYDFLIPEGFTLYANGVLVEEKYIAGEGIATDAYKLSGGKSGARYIPYTVDGFLSTPEFELKDHNGETVEPVYDEENSYYTVNTDTVTLVIPKGYTAYIGNSEVGSGYIVADSETPSALNSFAGEDVEGITYVSYKVGGFLEIPEVKVKNAGGIECSVRFDRETLTYDALPAYSMALRAQNEQWILDAFEKLVLYLQYVEYSKADIKVFFDTSSEAWKGISSINPSWQFEATSYTFEDESASEFVAYDDGHFSCRVRLTYIGRRGSAQYNESLDKIVFFKKSGDTYLIYNMPNTAAVSGLGMSD